MTAKKILGRPLSGKRIVVTRALAQASGFAKLLRNLGAKVLVCPTIRVVPPDSFKPLDKALDQIETYDWLIFTSANGVEGFFKRLKKIRRNGALPKTLKTCAIGPETARKMKELGFPVTKISKEYVAESILDVLPEVHGKKILIARAKVAREVLPIELKRRGANVDVVPVYQTVLEKKSFSSFRRWLLKSQIDCVTFTASSTVTNFFSALNAKESRAVMDHPKIRAASIGPITSGTLRSYGWEPAILARKPTTKHLAEALVHYYENEK